MSFYQRYGSFKVFNAFGGGAPELFPGGPPFMGGDDQGVFYGANTGFVQGSASQGFPWMPAPMAWQKQAADKWAIITGPMASIADSDFHDQIQHTFTTLLNSFYMAVGNHSTLGYSGDATQQIVSTGNQLKAALRQLIAYSPQPDPVGTVPTSSRNAATNAGTPSQQPTYPPNATSGSGPLASSSGAAVAESDNTMLYLALAGGVVVIGGALFLMRRKSTATAGYRRRRRR